MIYVLCVCMKIKGVVVCTNKYVAGRRFPRMRPNMSKHALALQPLVGSQCVSLSPTSGIMQPVVLLGCVTWVCACADEIWQLHGRKCELIIYTNIYYCVVF